MINIKRALVVDDCQHSRLLIRMILEPHGFCISEADGALHASQLLSTQAFDLVVLDIAMADVDGFTIARQLRAGELGGLNQSAPVIGWSGYVAGNPDLSRDATGMDHFFIKPIDVKRFSATANSLCDRLAS